MIWQDRTRTDPTKRKFIDENGNEQNVNIEEIQSNITQSGTPVNATTMNNIEKNIGTYGNDSYDSTATYLEGETVTHNALLYRAKQDIDTPEEWTEAHWEETSVLDELGNTSGNEVLISDDETDITRQTKIWIDTSDNIPFVNSEISNEYGTATNLGYAQSYQNEHNVVVSSTQPTTSERVWFKKSKNLFDFIKVEAGYLSGAGNVISNNDYSSSNYIYIKGFSKITVSGNSGNNENICFYNSNKIFISYEATGSNTSMTLNVPNNAYYVRATVKNTNLRQYQLEEGSTATTYEPYKQSINVDNEEIYNTNYNNYSTTEQVVGKWTDGKPIYRKCVSGTTKTDNNVENLVTNVDTFINYSVQVLRAGNNQWHPVSATMTAYDANHACPVFQYIDSHKICLYVKNTTPYQGQPYRGWVEYTKTTN